MGRGGMHIGYWWEGQKERDHSEDQDVGGWIIRKGADKSLAVPIYLFASQPKKFFLDGLKKLEQRCHKCVELKGDM
jgi:hypothetical protein